MRKKQNKYQNLKKSKLMNYLETLYVIQHHLNFVQGIQSIIFEQSNNDQMENHVMCILQPYKNFSDKKRVEGQYKKLKLPKSLKVMELIYLIKAMLGRYKKEQSLYLFARKRSNNKKRLSRDRFCFIKYSDKIEDVYQKYKWEQESILVICYAFEIFLG
ncbi:UNKNOWN [Stylonychia lemnae]|uniref:Uncharacterized protein n=1 Tax=Stylonychia lemnae TaxID=5949 RepID=A0A078ALE8_STYLE|nr:UNKNOWN [Stylonychia lemnae]|eukprot:CDW82232.1 UNKNOWN [Stylonychia lemnae]